MDVERIERALREGPPDEPTYAPGTFGRASRSGWRLAVAGLMVGVSLIVGITIGTGLGLLRDEVGGPAAPRVLTTGDLQGVWEASPIPLDAWTESLLARGFSEADVDAFLQHDPFEEQVHYQLLFVEERFTVRASYDGQPVQTLGGGTFTVDPSGVIHLVEVVDGLEGGCGIAVAADVDGSQLFLDVLDLPGCETDEQLANTLFFDIASYQRAEE